jgi:hypothetical protein
MYRWTARRKAQIVLDIIDGDITLQEACDHYNLSIEEITAWTATLERDAIAMLQLRTGCVGIVNPGSPRALRRRGDYARCSCAGDDRPLLLVEK